jgi:CRISPR-associated protein Cas1
MTGDIILKMLPLTVARYQVKLRLTHPARFHFNHGGALMGLMCRALLTHDLPGGMMPFACESGRVRFEPGDCYHIGLTLVGPACEQFNQERFVEGLQAVGGQRNDANRPQPTLGGNFEVIGMSSLPPPDVDEELARLKGRPSLTFHLLSPFRLERPSDLKVKGAGFLNNDCFPLSHFTRRLTYRLFLMAHERHPTPAEREALFSSTHLVEPSLVNPRLMWLDIPLEGAQGKHESQPKGYTIGGTIGKIAFRDVPESWLPTLVSGQHVHAGENSHYGLGRYVIEECSVRAGDVFRPARTIYQGLIDTALLDGALEHVAEHSVAAGVDGVTPFKGLENRDLLTTHLATEIEKETYRPEPLFGFVMPKDSEGLRPLTIPTVRDRVVQRAAVELLGPSVEALLEDCSYAYRKGFSRAGAARAIEKAYEDSYRYVLDADVTSFFDAVEWERMFAKLEALFPLEPLVQLIEHWVRAPVMFERRLIERERGLPQGAAISPLLANLYLDELDEELLGRDYRLVRFADDFVVLCKDLEAAQQAREDARKALAKMGLSLNEEKTAIRSFDEGFTYLGYLFCRSLVIEKEKEMRGEKSLEEIDPDDIPAASWLSQIPFEHVRELVRDKRGRRVIAAARDAVTSLKVVSLAESKTMQAVNQAQDGRRTLYVTNFDTTIHREGETLVVNTPDQPSLSIPIHGISQVICYGKTRLTLPLLMALNEEGIPAYFCRRSGELTGAFGPVAADWSLWMAQARTIENEELRVDFAREVVAAKLHNFAELSVRFKLDDAGQVGDEVRELERSCVNKTTLDALRGLEGRGALLYFQAMRETLAAEWNFAGRHTQPPTDPVNAMLSFGYTLLYHQLSTMLIAAGLNPRIGIFHAEHGAYHALACDLQEEFRHLVDAQVWAMINRREVKPTDFYATEDGRYPSLMKQEMRKRFIVAFEKRLLSEFTTPEGLVTTYRGFMERQVGQVKNLFLGHIKRYNPLRTRNR